MAGSFREGGPRFQELALMIDTITAGSILVAGGTHLPESNLLQGEIDSNGWAAIKDARPTFEKTIQFR